MALNQQRLINLKNKIAENNNFSTSSTIYTNCHPQSSTATEMPKIDNNNNSNVDVEEKREFPKFPEFENSPGQKYYR